MDWVIPVAARTALFFQVNVKFPTSSLELLDELDRLVPERVPLAGDSMEDIQRYAGKRELVLFLKNWRDQLARRVERKGHR